MLKRALFLDRDGVINVDHGYVYQKENFDFVNGIFELVATAKKAEYLVVVVTNQAGIGRGYYTETDFHTLMDWVDTQFLEHAGSIDAVYFCPHHPEHGIGEYRQKSHFRKPAPGMILQAANEIGINLSKSILVGDKESDIEAGLAAGIGNLFYFRINQKSDLTSAIQIADLSEVLPHLNSET